MEGTIIERILEAINSNIEDANITLEQADQDLQQYGLDSIAFIRMIVSLEEEFDVEVPDSFLLLPQMNTVNKIFDVINTIHSSNLEK